MSVVSAYTTMVYAHIPYVVHYLLFYSLMPVLEGRAFLRYIMIPMSDVYIAYTHRKYLYYYH